MLTQGRAIDAQAASTAELAQGVAQGLAQGMAQGLAPGPEHAALLGFALLVAATPGPSNVVLLAVGSRVGTVRGLPLLVGMAVGYALLWALAVLGLASMVRLEPDLLRLARWIGAGLMVWFAWRVVGSLAEQDSDPRETGDPRGSGVGVADGLVFQLLNPKAWLTAYAAAAMFSAGDDLPLHRAAVVGAAAGVAVLGGCGAWLVAGHLGATWLHGPLAGRVLRAGLIGSIAVSIAPVLLA